MTKTRLNELKENANYYLPVDPELLKKFNSVLKTSLEELGQPYLQYAKDEEILQFLKEVDFFNG